MFGKFGEGRNRKPWQQYHHRGFETGKSYKYKLQIHPVHLGPFEINIMNE
jgi:hypothetical protein